MTFSISYSKYIDNHFSSYNDNFVDKDLTTFENYDNSKFEARVFGSNSNQDWNKVFDKSVLESFNNRADFDKYLTFVGLINDFVTLLDKYTVKCQELRQVLLDNVSPSLELDFDEKFKVSKESFKTILKFLQLHKKGSSYDGVGKFVSSSWNLYLKTPKVYRLVSVYLKMFQLSQIEYSENSSMEFSDLIKYLKKSVRVLNSFVSYTNLECRNCGYIKNGFYSSDDINEPIFRESRAYDLKKYLRNSISYYRNNHQKYVRFLTLTIKRIPTSEYNKDVNKELKALFRKFVKRKFFKYEGYACVFEIKHYKIGDVREYKDHITGEIIKQTITSENEGYHPHLHILILGKRSDLMPIDMIFVKKLLNDKNVSKSRKIQLKKITEKDTVSWNWEDVCNKSKNSLFQGSRIVNIKTPESVLKAQIKRKKNTGNFDDKKFSEDEKTDLLIGYLTSYVTKVDEAVKSNNYDIFDSAMEESVSECPFINYIKSTERINFIQFGGVLLPSQIKKLAFNNENPIVELQDVSLKREKVCLNCPVCYESNWKLLSVGSMVDSPSSSECLRLAYEKLLEPSDIKS